MPSAKPKAKPASKAPVIKFRVQEPHKSARKRARYDPERRQEVKVVRKNRACLRCIFLKIRCSDNAVCVACSELILHKHEKQVLSFSACIRTRIVELGFFEAYMPQPAHRDSILAKANELASSAISLQFASKVTWDLNILTNDVISWLCGPGDSYTSKVGILSSPEFLELIDSSINSHERTNFQCMIYAESLAYTQPTALGKHSLSTSDLRQIGAIAGHETLKWLDKKLNPQSLQRCSCGDIQVLFLLVFGTILAITYTAGDADFMNEKPESTAQELHQLPARKYHLCQILAHYLVYLGSHLKLPIPSHTEQFLLEAAPVRWHKRGLFQWASDAEDGQYSTENSNYDDSLFEMDGCFPTSGTSLRDHALNLEDNMNIENQISARRSCLSYRDDIGPDMPFGQIDNTSIWNTDLESLSIDYGSSSWTQDWAYPVQDTPPKQLETLDGADMQDPKVQTKLVPSSQDVDVFMDPPPDYWDELFQPQLDLVSESVKIGNESKDDNPALRDDHDLYWGKGGSTGQCHTTLQEVQFPARRRKKLDPTLRKAAAYTRRNSACFRCSLRTFSFTGHREDICRPCEEINVVPMPLKVRLFLPEPQFHSFHHSFKPVTDYIHAERYEVSTSSKKVGVDKTASTATKVRAKRKEVLAIREAGLVNLLV